MVRSQGDEQTAEQGLACSVEIAKLQQANTDLDRLGADLEGQPTQSREELCLAIEWMVRYALTWTASWLNTSVFFADLSRSSISLREYFGPSTELHATLHPFRLFV